MKKLISAMLVVYMLFSLSGCGYKEKLEYSKDSLSEFLEVLKTEDKNYLNVTPETLEGKINLRIFKNEITGESYILMGAETFKICEGGSFGFIDAIDCDYDKNNKSDLLISFNDEEGAKLVVFDAEKKVFKGKTLVSEEGAYLINKTKKISVGEGLSSVKVEGFAYNLIEIKVKPTKNFAKIKYNQLERVGEAELTQKGPVFKEGK